MSAVPSVQAPAAATNRARGAAICSATTGSGAACSSAAALLKAVAGASFSLTAGRTLAVVGESGCGKSTLARMVTMIEKPTSGPLMIDGTDVVAAGRQDAARAAPEGADGVPGSLRLAQPAQAGRPDPGRAAGDQHRQVRQGAAETARAMMARVGLRPEFYTRYPHMFSGGQRQRIAIARALILQSARSWWRTSRSRRSTFRSAPRC